MCDFAEAAEAADLTHLWLVDHFGWDDDPFDRPNPFDPPDLGVWEAWTTLAALAAHTQRISLGTLVTCTRYRNPTLLAKMADSVDEISGGRLILGLGAGDYPEEQVAFGYDSDKPVGHFEEALAIVTGLLRDGSIDFDGTFYRAHAELRPRGPTPEGPPILIGSLGHGPRVLGLVARFADIWNGWITDRSHARTVPSIREAVDDACKRVGRDPATLRRSVAIAVAFDGPMAQRSGTMTGSEAEIAAALSAFADAGVDDVQVRLFPNTPSSVERLGRIIAAM